MAKNYDVGLGTKNFNLFVKGRKSAIASKSADNLITAKQVDAWARKKYIEYLKTKMKRRAK